MSIFEIAVSPAFSLMEAAVRLRKTLIILGNPPEFVSMEGMPIDKITAVTDLVKEEVHEIQKANEAAGREKRLGERENSAVLKRIPATGRRQILILNEN